MTCPAIEIRIQPDRTGNDSMNPLMGRFFDALSDGIVLVNPAGIVTYTNSTGLRLFKVTRGEAFPDPRVVEAVRDVAAGIRPSPTKVAAGDGVLASARQATISQLPIPNTYAVSIHDTQEKAFYDTTLDNLYEFIGIELAEPLATFARHMETYSAEAGRGSEDSRKLAEEGMLIATRLGRIRLLADIFKTAPLVAQERLPFADMITDELSAVSDAMTRREITVYLNGLEQELPPVYGSRVWLAAAFRELINNAVRYSPAKSALEILVRCTGTHVVVQFRNHGMFANKSLLAHRVFVPFNQVVQLVKEKRMPARALTGKRVEPGTERGPGLGLPICHQIAELHGGQLRIKESEEDGTVDFSLELATGAPAKTDQHMDIAQAQRYAKDMAALVSRMRKKNEVPLPGAQPPASNARSGRP